jgi:hypothetical protein
MEQQPVNPEPNSDTPPEDEKTISCHNAESVVDMISYPKVLNQHDVKKYVSGYSFVTEGERVLMLHVNPDFPDNGQYHCYTFNDLITERPLTKRRRILSRSIISQRKFTQDERDTIKDFLTTHPQSLKNGGLFKVLGGTVLFDDESESVPPPSSLSSKPPSIRAPSARPQTSPPPPLPSQSISDDNRFQDFLSHRSSIPSREDDFWFSDWWNFMDMLWNIFR